MPENTELKNKRQQAYEGRMKDEGYKRLCFWVHKNDEVAVKTAVGAILYAENDE